MGIPIDPGIGLQDNVKEPIKVGGATGLHARFKLLYDALNGALDTDNLSPALLALINNSAASVPVGTILAFYDFDAAVTFDTDLFKYCDGSVIVDAESPINGETLPDLSNRYLVGFGTEGGGDIDSAVWASAAVGNANHQINLQHSHTVTSHTHSLSSHTHTAAAHTHNSGTLKFKTFQYDSGSGKIIGYNISGSNTDALEIQLSTAGAGVNTLISAPGLSTQFYTVVGSGVTGSDGNDATGTPSNNTSGSAAPGMDNQLSATQSIQPRSIRVRYIMRYK
jgi:hypothetical protein